MKSPLLQPLNALTQTRPGLARWVPTFVLLAFLVSFSQAELSAANITVTTSADAGAGSLRAAITTLNGSVGPHNITFDPSVTIVNLTSNLPAITRQININGGGTVTVSVPAGDGGYIIFTIGAGGNGTTLRGMTIQNTGHIPIYLQAALSNVTLLDLLIKNNAGDLINYGIYCEALVTNMVIRNVDMRDIQYGTWWGLDFIGSVDGLIIDNVDISSCSGYDERAIQFQGATNNNILINNCTFDISNSTDPNPLSNALEGYYGIYFNNALTNVTLDSVIIPTAEIYGLRTNTATNLTITNSYFGNARGGGGAMGIRLEGVVNGLTIDNTTIDLDNTATLTPLGDDGDYGFYCNTTVTNANINKLKVHDCDIRNVFFGNGMTNGVITNSTFDSHNGHTGMLQFEFNGPVNNLVMTNIWIDSDVDGTTDDGDYGLRFIGAVDGATLTNVNVKEADIYGVHLWVDFKNVTWTGGNLLKNGTAIRNDNCNYSRRNVKFQNMEIDSSVNYGVYMHVCTGGVADSVAFVNDTISNSGIDGIQILHANVATLYTIKNCLIRGNGRTSTAGDGIQVTAPDNVVITQNSIYDNAGLGINLTGNGNCLLEAALAPSINSVTPMGGNQYLVNYTIPVANGAGTYKAEFFTNGPIAGIEGEYYVHTVSGLSTGVGLTTTITTNTGPAATPKTANLTMTFTRTGAACNGTSEFSNSLALDPQGPGCVSSGIAMWVRADKITGVAEGGNVSQWIDFSGNGRKAKQFTVAAQPKYRSTTLLMNFNPVVQFDGSDDRLDFPDRVGITDTKVFTIASAIRANSFASYGSILGGWAYGMANYFHADGRQIIHYHNVGDLGYSTKNNVVGIPNILLSSRTTAAGNYEFYNNGATDGAFTNGTSFSTDGFARVGGSYIPGNYNPLNGVVGDLIVYNRPLTNTERQKINTYLSIKYGISFDTTVAKVAGVGNNYILGDGTIIWTANPTYYHRITGIGRDDCDSLVQRQSQNVITTHPGYATIGLGTVAISNAANPNNFAADKRFLVWGDDGVSGSTGTTISGDGVITLSGTSCAQYARMGKTFKVQETGTVGVVQVRFNMTNIKIGKTAADYYLAINNTNAFVGTITKLVAATSYDNVTGTLVFDGVDFADGQFFTVIGRRVYGPAGITTNLKLWLKGDEAVTMSGASVASWEDQGPAGNLLTGAGGSGMTYTVFQNFNPVLTFPGGASGNFLNKNGGILGSITTYTGATVFAMTKAANTGQNSRLFEENLGVGGSYFGTHLPYIGTIYSDFPINTRINIATPAAIATQHNIWGFYSAPSSQAIYQNDRAIHTGTIAASSYKGNGSAFHLGSYTGVQDYAGTMGEIIVFSQALSDDDRRKINSYLAVKWGITLDQTTPYDYWAADGTVIWNATTNSLYKNRITGIGRDDCSDIIQRQSRNQDTTSAFVTMGLGTIAANNVANTNNFTADESFLLWGDDGVAGAATTTVTGDGTITLNPGACGVFRRLAKTFKVQKTGTVGAVQIKVNLRGVSLGKVASDHYLAIHSSATFSGVITKLVQATSYSGGILTFDNVTLTDGQFFTIIGKKAQGPANLTTNLKLWLRADDGISLNGSTVDSWTDQGPGGNDVTQVTVANQPVYNELTNLINFNPTLTFDGANDYMRTSANIYGTGNISYTTFGIVDHTTVAASRYLLSDGVPGVTNQNIFFGHQGAVQTQGNWNNDFQAGPIAANIPYLQGYTRDASTNVRTNYQSAKSMGSSPVLTAINKTNNGFSYIGATTNTANFLGAKVGEVITFESVLTAPELVKVNSYLAVKWGFTLDQTTPYEYKSANNTTIWPANVVGYSTYKNRITGIGRDDCSDLQQKQSKSVETGALVTISNGSTLATTNELNGSSYTADNSWLLFADNNKGLTWTGSGVPINGGNVRLNRVWRVAETGTVGTVYLEVPDNTSALATKLPATTNSIYLLVATTATSGKFSALSGVTVQQMTYDATNKKWYTTYNFADGDYFTFGSEKVCIAPVGISEGLTTWYHATNETVGAAGATLPDLAFGVYPLTKAGTVNVVAGSATSFNYNRSMTFTAGSFSRGALTNTDVIDATAGSMMAVGTSSTNLFAISSTAVNSSGLLNPSAQFNGTNGTYGAGIASSPNIYTMIGSTANVKGYTNGTAGVTSGSIAARAAGAYTLGLGRNGSNAGSYTGSIAEAFSFDRVLDPEEKDILESYLAIKYGQTLSHNYFNADYDGTNAASTTLYDVSTYANRVFGIGTDTTGCFYQKQSTSALSGSMLKMSLGTSLAAENSGNTATFSRDRSYVMAGDDGGSIAAWVVGGGANPDTLAIYSTTCIQPTRINRQWKVTGTYLTPTVLFTIPDATSSEATKLPPVLAGHSVWMVINNNTDFGINAFQQEVQMTLNATTLNWEGQYLVSPGTTKYITFAMKNDAIATGANAGTVTIVETDNSCVADDGKVLSGAPALLTPTVGASYMWSTGPTTPTLTVNPTMTTTYTVTVTALNGCTSSATTTVTVGIAPTAVITETDLSCAHDDNQVLSGDPATLTASGGNTYLWDNVSNLAVRVVNPTSTTTYTVTVTDVGGCSATASRTITIVSLPVVNLVGSNSICIGDMTSVSPTSGGTWSSSDPAVATVTNAGVVTGVSAGSVAFNFTATGSGCVSVSTPAVTVNPTPVVSITGSNNICIGSTTALSPNTGGTWVSNSPSIATVDPLTGVVTGVAIGTATFTFTNSTTGCVSAPTSALTVNALPVVTITGASTICVGATTNLSPTTGGTWVSSNPAIASVTNAGLVTGVTAGTVTFTFTKTAAPNCGATTATVTVNALPIVSISGSNTICVGTTTTLLPASGGTWVSNTPARATVTNAGVVTAVSAGTVTFTFTSTATGCVSTTSPVTIDPLPVVAITGTSSICADFTTTLSPTSGGTWASSAPAVATVTNAGVVTGVAMGTATFSFTLTATGCTSLPTSAVSVTDLPAVSITGASTICVGSTTTLSPTSGGTWTSSNPAIATVTNAGLVTGITAGTATFTFTSSTSPNCAATTSTVTLLAQPAVSITGATTICVGATTALSPTSGGTWTSSNPLVATVSASGVVTGVSAGTATFNFTDSGTGCVSLTTGTVTVNALPVVSIVGSSSICAGSTTTLSPTTGGNWVSSNPSVAAVTNAGVVTGLSAGTATFTFTNSSTGCASMPTSAVTVNAIPLVTISGATSICIGANSGLTPTSGGTWASSNAAVATVDNAGVVTGVSAGTATFTFTQTGTGCVSAATAAITVNPTPVTSITGASSICIGATTTLSPTGGTWTSSNPLVATVTNAGVVTGVAAGMATFTFTSGTTGCQSAASSPVTVNAPPSVSITGSASICVGTTTVLSPTSGGTWVSSDPSVATVTNIGVVTGVSAGLATFTFTNTSTGCVSAATAPITVNPLPVVNISGPNTICVGFTTGLSPSTGGTWASSNAAVATVSMSGVVTGVSAGTATFTFTNTTTGCVSAPTGSVTVNAIPVVSITGATNICVGATTALSPASGGTWVSTNAGVATVTNAGIVTAVAAGTATFIFTSSSTGCVSVATGTVTVSATPIVSVTGASNICIGATTGLSPSSGGTWASSNAAVATVTNAGVVTAVSAGTVTFTFTDAGGCVSTPTTAVTVNPTPVVSITGGNTICVGLTTTLSPASGGTWVSSAPGVASVTNAGVVTGVSGGSATFTFTNTATGCVSAATSAVTVNPLPVVSITGGTSICVGASTNLSPTSGGTWSSSNAGIATVTNAGVVTGVSAGTVNFTFTNSVTGCVSPTTSTVTVNPLPVVSITGTASICVGATTTVSPTTGGTWASSNPAVASVTSAGLVTGLTSGTATFTFTNTTTGCVSAATSAVTVNPIPVVFITGSSSICIGSTTTLSPTTGGTWMSSNPAVATVTNAGLVTGVSAGTVTFSFTNTATGCVSLATSSVTVNAAPVVSITGVSSICVGATTTLSPTSGGSWASSNAAVATVTGAGVVTGVSSGTATFTFTSSLTGCSSAATSAITVSPTPIVSITGANNICVAATTTLSPTTGGNWASSNPAVATVTSGGVVTGVSAGTATFTFTLTATGCTSAATSLVTVNALPVATITGASSICIGSTTTLSPTSGGTWTSSAPAVATVTNGGVVTAVSAGTVTFTFTSSTTGCTSAASATVTVAACNSLVAVKAFLGGAYNPGVDMMNDDLRAASLIPTAQPYNGVQYGDFSYTGTETIGGGVLSVTGVNAIVDWVLLELRSASNPATVVARKAALIQRDGDVVESSNGTSAVTFIGAPAGNYYVVIRHRNHLGVMSSAAITLSGTIGTPVNFTSAATSNYQLSGALGSSHAQRTLANGKRALWEGNMSNNSGSGNLVQYQGTYSDSDEPYFKVLLDPGNVTVIPNYIVLAYDRADGNLDGKVIYQGSDSDSDIPFFEVYTFPDNILFLPNFIIFQQIP